MRRLRTEADLRPAVAHRQLSRSSPASIISARSPRTLRDLAAAYDALQGADAAIRPARSAPPSRLRAALGERHRRACASRVLGGYFDAHFADAAARAAVDRVAPRSASRATVDVCRRRALGRAAAFLITDAEGGALHLPTCARARADFEPLSRDRFLAGALLPAAWYRAGAARARAGIASACAELFARRRRADRAGDAVRRDADRQPSGSSSTAARLPVRPSLGLLDPADLVHRPAGRGGAGLRLPGRLPIGVQIIAAPWREDLMLRVAAALAASRRRRGAAAALHA